MASVNVFDGTDLRARSCPRFGAGLARLAMGALHALQGLIPVVQRPRTEKAKHLVGTAGASGQI